MEKQQSAMKTSDDREATKDDGSSNSSTSSDSDNSGCEERNEQRAIRQREEDLNENSNMEEEVGEDQDQMEEREVLPGITQNSEDATSYQKRWAELYGRLLAFREVCERLLGVNMLLFTLSYRHLFLYRNTAIAGEMTETIPLHSMVCCLTLCCDEECRIDMKRIHS
jgi:hypothetical protein